ncbi:DMT family transporter [Sphingomonas sp. GCM10030256]|uniref:DMT family transporter n=1 Tax=Sphingomonas sp. GCM10030256 TaxID=3273427 RepID=UPI0036068D59
MALFDPERPAADTALAPAKASVVAPQMGRTEWAMLLGLALVWGCAFMFIKVAVASFPPVTYVWLRIAMAALTALVILKVSGKRLPLSFSLWASVGVLALLNNVIPFLLFGWGQKHIASGLAAILQATTPIFGVVAAHFLTADERITSARLGGVLVGFAGVSIMIGPQLAGDGGNQLVAQLACLLASLLYALAGIHARRFKRLGVGPLELTTAQFIAGTAILTPVALLVDRPWLGLPTAFAAWGAVAVLAVVCSALAYVIFFRLIERAGATNSLLVTLLVPPVALVAGALAFGERFGASQIAGLFLIGAGLAAIDGRLLAAVRRYRASPIKDCASTPLQSKSPV